MENLIPNDTTVVETEGHAIAEGTMRDSSCLLGNDGLSNSRGLTQIASFVMPASQLTLHVSMLYSIFI